MFHCLAVAYFIKISLSNAMKANNRELVSGDRNINLITIDLRKLALVNTIIKIQVPQKALIP